MKLTGITKIGFLAVLMLIAFSAFAWAACPPGAIMMNQNGIDVNGDGVVGVGEGVFGGIVNLGPNLTYCIASNIDIEAWGGGAAETRITVQQNSGVYGSSVAVTLDGTAAAFPVVEVQGSDVALKDFTVSSDDTGGAQPACGIGVWAAGNDVEIENVRVIDDNGPYAAAGLYLGNHIEILGGLNARVTHCEIRNNVRNAPGGIFIGGGNDHQLVGNRVEVWPAGESAFAAVNLAGGNGHLVDGTSIIVQTPSRVIEINVGTTNSAAQNNNITFAAGAYAVPAGATGINVNNAMVDVLDNTVTNPGGFVAAANGGGALVGINVTPAGTNCLVQGNRVSGCGTTDNIGAPWQPGDAVRVAAANVQVLNNPLLTSVACGGLVLDDMACGVRVVAGAASVNVSGNSNISAATSGIAVHAPTTAVENNTISSCATGVNVPNFNGGLGATTGEPMVASGITIGAPGTEKAPVSGNTVLNIAQHGQPFAGTRAGGDGITLVAGSSNQLVQGNTFQNAANNGVDIEAAGAVSHRIVDNNISHSQFHGVNITVGAPNTVIDDNRILNNRRHGVYVNAAALNTEVINNEFSGNGELGSPTIAPNVSVAVLLMGGANNSLIGGNDITAGAALPANYGIMITGVRDVTVENNQIHNTGNLTHGIVVSDGTANDEVSGNDITNVYEAGIVIDGGSSTLGNLDVYENNVQECEVGILIQDGASDSYDNCLIWNSKAVEVERGVQLASHTFTNNCVCAQSGQDYVLQNEPGTFNVEDNFWGEDPPDAAKFIGGGSVDYTPWLADCPHDYCPDCQPTPGPTGPSNTYGAAAGWYMVSRPRNSDTTANPFGAVAYNWNPVSGVYDTPATVEPDGGYWVMLPANTTVTDDGSQVTTDVTINLSSEGWHQIGCPWNGLPKSAIEVRQAGGAWTSWANAKADGWIRDDIYTYAPTSVNYTMPTTLNAWMGYWVKALVSGISLKLPVSQGTIISAGASVAPKALVVPADLPPMPPTPTVGVGSDLEFVNYPNPVTDVHTTTFAVKGAGAAFVSALKVQIYDLAGRLVFEDEVAGASLAWHTDSSFGEYLANGVYLYKLYALVNGEWVASEVKKLAILR